MPHEFQKATAGKTTSHTASDMARLLAKNNPGRSASERFQYVRPRNLDAIMAPWRPPLRTNCAFVPAALAGLRSHRTTTGQILRSNRLPSRSLLMLSGNHVAMSGNKIKTKTITHHDQEHRNRSLGDIAHLMIGHALQHEQVEPDGRGDLGHLDDNHDERCRTRSGRSPPRAPWARPPPWSERPTKSRPETCPE